MAGVNKCIVVGNVGSDPELKHLPSGDAVTNFSIAVNQTWKDKNGENQESTEWIPLDFFGKQAEIVTQYVRKGSQLYVEGKFKTRKYTDKDGIEKYTTSIRVDHFQFLGKRQEVRDESSDPFKDEDIPF